MPQKRLPSPKVAVFGGSFNPPHIGHVMAAVYAIKALGMSRVLVIPVFRHTFGKHLVSFEHRIAMCRLAFGGLRGVSVSKIEARLPQPSRTLTTLQHLTARYPHWQLRLLIGSDIVCETARWHAFGEVARLAPPLILARPGSIKHATGAGLQLPAVSSTAVREALHAPSRKHHLLDQWLPHAVNTYIKCHRLYRQSAG